MADSTLAALDVASSALIDALKAVDAAREQLRSPPEANLKPAPLFLQAAVLTGGMGPRFAQLPVLPVKLVDRPRASADPVLAKANDDLRAEEPADAPVKSRCKAPKVELDPAVWDAFVEAYLGPDRPTLSEAYRRACAFAASCGIGVPSYSTFWNRTNAENLRRPLVGPATMETPDSAAPLGGTSVGEATPPPAVARQPVARPVEPALLDWPDAPLLIADDDATTDEVDHDDEHQPEERGTRPEDGRSACHAGASQEGRDGRAAGEGCPLGRVYGSPGIHGSAAGRRFAVVHTERSADLEPSDRRHDEADDIHAAFTALVAAARAKREGQAVVISPKPVFDPARTAAAFSRKAVGTSRAAKKAPTEHAPSTESCRHCGIPGSKGCDHFLPYEYPSGARA